MNKSLNFDEFNPIDEKQWKEQLAKDLKDKTFEDIITQTDAGLKINPFYTKKSAHDAKFSSLGNNNQNSHHWFVKETISGENDTTKNKQALAALKAGASALQFDHFTSIERLLENIQAEILDISFDSEKNSLATLNNFIDLLNKRNVDITTVSGAVLYSPLKNLALTGNWYHDEEKDFQLAADLVQKAKPTKLRCINIDASIYHNAGANLIDELAYTLAAGNTYLANLTEKNIAIEDIAKAIQFTVSANINYFESIVKMRALRILWANVVKAYQPKNKNATSTFISATTSAYHTTTKDVYVNMLRTTSEGMSAILGGADSLEVLPFDYALKNQKDFGKRIARNVSLILKEESFFDKVIDPSAGAYFIENLTHQICEKVWAKFQAIEKQGGFLTALKNNTIQEEIEKSALKNKEKATNNEINILGVNKYKNQSEKKQESRNIYPDENPKNTLVKPIRQTRISDELEKEIEIKL